MNKKILKTENLSFSYREIEKNVLSKVYIEFAANEITGILGCNGSGKSTLLDCIMGLNIHYSGKVLLFDKNIKDYSLKSFSKIVSYLPQSINKSIDFKVVDYLMFGRSPYLSIYSMPKKDDYEKACMYAEKIGIKEFLNKKFNQLSGGEKQLVRIAKILMQETEIILLDEPTASLDFGNQYKILDLLTLLKNEGKTIIFTIHNPWQLLEYNYNVAVLNNSEIIAKGQAKEIINDSIIRTIYGEDIMKKWSKIKEK